MAGAPRGKSLAGRVVRAVEALAADHPDGVPVREIAYAVDIDAGREPARRLRKTIADLKKRGKLRHAGVGRYAPVDGRLTPELQDDGKGRMWRALRLKHRRGEGVTYDTLAQMAGVGRSYAQEYMRMLARRGIVERVGRGRAAVWRMVADPVEMPDFADNPQKLRQMRERRRRALALMRQAVELLADEEDEP